MQSRIVMGNSVLLQFDKIPKTPRVTCIQRLSARWTHHIWCRNVVHDPIRRAGIQDKSFTNHIFEFLMYSRNCQSRNSFPYILSRIFKLCKIHGRKFFLKNRFFRVKIVLIDMIDISVGQPCFCLSRRLQLFKMRRLGRLWNLFRQGYN